MQIECITFGTGEPARSGEVAALQKYWLREVVLYIVIIVQAKNCYWLSKRYGCGIVMVVYGTKYKTIILSNLC